MTRVMIDTTHNGFSAAQAVIRGLKTGPSGDIVALYDTGSPGIAATPADLAALPAGINVVMIDQGFTGSPNLNANVRDCENGAWTIPNAVNKAGWDVARPTLYLGFPDTVQEAFDAGWRGDVWLVGSAISAPTTIPPVPVGINVVGIQWNFSNPNYDLSVIFDPTWPGVKVPVTPTAPPGQWKDPKAWEWQQVQIIGRGLDNVLYTFEYRVKTGQWVKISSPAGS